MRWIGKSSGALVGIDVGSRHIKAAQVRRSRAGWEAQAISVIPRANPSEPIDEQEARNLKAVLRRQGFGGSDVVLAAPPDKLLTGLLEVPPRGSKAPRGQIARMELSRMHKAPLGSFEMSYWDLPASAKARDAAHIMAVACEHDEANKVLDVFESAGLSVRALDVHACALARACQPMLAPGPAVTAILDLGWSSTRLSIVCQGVVTYQRSLGEACLRSLVETIGNRFQLNQEETGRVLAEVGFGAQQEEHSDARSFDEVGKELARHFGMVGQELEAPFTYAAQQYSEKGVEKLLLLGGGAGIPYLPQYLRSLLKIEVETVSPANLAKCPPWMLPKSSNPALVAAVGLALFDEECPND